LEVVDAYDDDEEEEEEGDSQPSLLSLISDDAFTEISTLSQTNIPLCRAREVRCLECETLPPA
jgi:hypothetical protein